MSRDPGLEDTAAKSSASEDVGSAETLAPEGTEPGARPQDAWLRARVMAELFGGERAKIGRFEVLGSIGAGGMSVVCRARDPDLDREVAIKLLQGGAALSEHGRARLQREARAMARLSHPNVATVFEVGVHAGEVFVAMELVPGQTLGAWCRAHEGEVPAILATYLAAGEGLAAAHAAGFIHRDFKPDNVIVGDDGRPRVLDFGLAAVLGESIVAREREPVDADRQGVLTMTGTVLGTPAYMAPEQHRGDAVDARTDQFAYCVSLWEALGGARPFAGATLGELARSVCAGTIDTPPRTIPPRVEAILRRGLALAPGDRFASMRALLDAIAAAQRGRGAKRWLVGAAIVGVVGTVGLVLVAQRDPPPAVAIPPIEPPPAPPVDTPAPVVELTRTPGSGVDLDLVFMDATAQRVVYRAGGELWQRSVSGTPPEPIAWRHEGLDPVAFDGAGWIATDDEFFYRVRPETTPERLAFAARPQYAVQIAAPDYGAVLLFQRAGSTVQRLGSDPVEVLAGYDVAFAEWAPDGQRWAAVVVPVDGHQAELLVLDLAGTVLHRAPVGEIQTDGLVWLGDRIAMIDPFEEPPTVTCFAVGDEGIAAPVERRIELPRGVSGTVVQGSAHGDLLLVASRTYRDVGILALDDAKTTTLQALSADLQASNFLPLWLDDQRLAFVSDRFGDEAVMTDDAAGGHARPDRRFEGRAIACGLAGSALSCIVADAQRERSLWRADGDARAHEIGPAPDVADIECAGPTSCIALVLAADAPAEIHGLDPATGALTRRFACGKELHCVPERIALAPDGRSLLLVDGANVRRVDATTGIELDPSVVAAPEGEFVQSAIELGPRDFVSTQSAGRGEAARYRVVRTTDGVDRTLWEAGDRWVVRPRVSPDGRRIALTTMHFHLEAALARDPCRIGAP